MSCFILLVLLRNFSNTGGVLKTVTTPLDQFSFFSAGSDNKLNLKEIQKIGFAVTRGDGGNGTFEVDTIEAPDGGVDQSVNLGGLVTNLRIENSTCIRGRITLWFTMRWSAGRTCRCNETIR